MNMSITLKPDIKAKLIKFKSESNCRTFNDAVKLLLDKKYGNLFVRNIIMKKFHEFCDVENCKTDSEGLRKLLERYHMYGLPKIRPEEFLEIYLKGYDWSVEDIEIRNIIDFIDTNLNSIIEQISQEEIDIYNSIQEQFLLKDGNIENDSIFRYLFKKFYLSSSARFFTEKSYNLYFSILSGLKITKLDNINDIIKYLLEKLKPMRNKLEYSYTSKILHTINPKFPIYDSYIRKVLNLKEIEGGSNDQRINNFLNQYNKIIQIYREIIKNNLLETAIKKLGKKRDISRLSPVKAIDFLLWSAGKLINKQKTKSSLHL